MEGCSIAPIPDLLMKHGDVTLDARLVFGGWAKTTGLTARGLVSRPRASGSVLRAENSESDLPKMKRQNAYRYRLLPLQKTNKERALVSQAMVEKDVMLQPVSADHESSRLTKMDDEILQPRSVATTQFL